jgi:hypothetical protein
MTPKRVCLTCKNKGCLAQCRFPKAPQPSAKDQIKSPSISTK